MKLNDWPLIDLFTRLRGAGLPLGVDDYELLLLAMKGNFGENRESLYRLCCTLWIKSEEDKRIFDIIFDEFLSEPLNRETPSIKQKQLWNAWSLPFHPFNWSLILGGVCITVWIVLLLIGQINEKTVEKPTPIQDISRILEQLQKIQDIDPKKQLQPIIIDPKEQLQPIISDSRNQLLPTPTHPGTLPEIIFSSATLLQVDKDIEKIKQVNLNKEQTEQQLGINDEMLKKIHDRVIFFKRSGITLKHIEQIGISDQKEAIKEELSVIFQRINKCAEVLRKLEMTDMSKVNGQISGLTLDEIKKLRLTAEQFQKLDLPPNIIDILTNTRTPIEIKTGIRSSAPTERITIGLLLAIAVVARLVTARRMSKSASTPETALPKTKTTTVPEGAGITPNMADLNDEASQSGYVLPDMCLPITRRQMQQSWRHLCRRVREGAAVELDVEATINKMGRQGMLLEFVQVPRRINRAELLLLIDQGGSMVPFHIASRQLVETVLQGGRLGKIGIYYFHNWLDRNICLYLNSNLQGESITFTEILSYLHSQYTSVMIFSDGGAARGHCNEKRIDRTHFFLGELRKRVRHIVWLNPVPRDRWKRTTARKIAESVPMFEFDRRGLQNAISVLQGKLQYTQPKD